MLTAAGEGRNSLYEGVAQVGFLGFSGCFTPMYVEEFSGLCKRKMPLGWVGDMLRVCEEVVG